MFGVCVGGGGCSGQKRKSLRGVLEDLSGNMRANSSTYDIPPGIPPTNPECRSGYLPRFSPND